MYQCNNHREILPEWVTQSWGSRGQWGHLWPWGVTGHCPAAVLGSSSPLRISNSIILQSPGCCYISLWVMGSAAAPQEPGTFKASKEGRSQPGAQELWGQQPGEGETCLVDLGQRNFRVWQWEKGNKYMTCLVRCLTEQLKEHCTVKTWFMFMATRYTSEKLKNSNYFHLLLFPEYFGITCFSK